MERKKVGLSLRKSLRKSTSRDVIDEVEEGKKESVLMNPVRLRVFEKVCEMPCITASVLSRTLGFSISTAEWHLDKLAGADYVAFQKGKKKVGYFARGQITAGEVPGFNAVNQSETAREVFEFVFNEPGHGLKDICREIHLGYQSVRWHVKSLSEQGVVEEIKDGRSKRLFPHRSWKEKVENRERSKLFRKSLVKRFKEDRLEPEIRPSKDHILNVILEVAGRHHEAHILLNPYIIL